MTPTEPAWVSLIEEVREEVAGIEQLMRQLEVILCFYLIFCFCCFCCFCCFLLFGTPFFPLTSPSRILTATTFLWPLVMIIKKKKKFR